MPFSSHGAIAAPGGPVTDRDRSKGPEGCEYRKGQLRGKEWKEAEDKFGDAHKLTTKMGEKTSQQCAGKQGTAWLCQGTWGDAWMSSPRK